MFREPDTCREPAPAPGGRRTGGVRGAAGAARRRRAGAGAGGGGPGQGQGNRLTMCLAIPARVVERLQADDAIIDAGGVEKRVSLALVPEAAVGDYVIC